MKSHWFHSVIKCNHNLIRGQQKRMTLAASGQAPAPPSCEWRRGSWERLCGRRLRTWDLLVQTLAREPRQSRIPAGGKGRSAHRLPPQACPELLEFQLCLLLTSNLLPQHHPPAFSLISWATQHPAPSTWLFCSNYPSQVDLLFAIMNLDLDKLLNSWAFTSMQNGLYSMQTLLKKLPCSISFFPCTIHRILHLLLFLLLSPLHARLHSLKWVWWERGGQGAHRGEKKWKRLSLLYCFSENTCRYWKLSCSCRC